MSYVADSSTAARRILVVEDECDIAHLLELHLCDLGHEVTLEHTGPAGLARAETTHFDLIILDLRLPGLDGLDLCRRVRHRGDYTPILMLTAKSTETDRVLGLELGADDYLTKPFSIPELLARVKALFRRIEAYAAHSVGHDGREIHAHDLTIDFGRRHVTIEDRPVALTAKEFDLLAHFAVNPGRVYTRAQLLDAVWGYGHEGYEHTVNSHINRLRAKIERNPGEPRYILTIWGVGYKFTDADTERL